MKIQMSPKSSHKIKYSPLPTTIYATTNTVQNLKTNKFHLKWFLVLLFTIGFILYISLAPIESDYFRFIRFKKDDDGYNADDEFDGNSSYFVANLGCKMPSFPIMNEEIKAYVDQVKPIECKAALTVSDDTNLWIDLDDREIQKYYNVQEPESIKCFYQEFKRKSDRLINLNETRVSFGVGEVIKINDEFIKVECFESNQTVLFTPFYTDYHAFVPLKEDVEARCEENLKNNKNAPKLNVMVLGIDSVSRLNFHRQMNKTVNYLLQDLYAVEMFGYNKVGDNTYPNLIPTLTGFDVDELAASCLPYTNSTFDLCPFIWNKFEEAGYRTSFVEDVASLATFNYFKKGFIEQPTDYYLRNFIKEAEDNIGTNKKLNVKLCLAGRNPTEVFLDYIKKLVHALKDKLSFTFLWECALTHDNFNYPALIDEGYLDLLREMHEINYLNKTALILMSDHGIRWGSFRNTYQGMMEERQPFLHFVLPQWFKTAYPLAYRNMRRNRNKLTTHFDLYETMKDFLELDTLLNPAIRQRAKDLLDEEPISKGISLFLPIPPSRTCESAGIGSHWCTCHEHKPIPTTDSRVIMAARFAVDKMNEDLHAYPQCSILHLHTITDANLGVTNDNVLTNQKKNKKTFNHFSDINVRFQTKPGGGEFEATVRLDMDNGVKLLTGSISRTNLYGKQSYCVDDYNLKLYCYCAR